MILLRFFSVYPFSSTYFLHETYIHEDLSDGWLFCWAAFLLPRVILRRVRLGDFLLMRYHISLVLWRLT